MFALAMGRLSNRKGPVGRSSLLAVELAPRHSFYDRCILRPVHSTTGAFYDRCNEILAEAEFDETVEMLCQPSYEDGGRLSVPPGRYFRMLFVGQFEGLDSEREIEWRCADSLSLHRFLGLVEGERVPDHSTLSVTRSRLPLEVHHAVFGFILEIAGQHDLVPARRIGVDASTPQANAALRRLVRRDTGEDYQERLRRLARASGLETPTMADLDPFRPRPQGQDAVQRRLGVANRSGGAHRPDEGRSDPSRRQAGTRGRSRHRGDRGGQDPPGRSRRHPDPARYLAHAEACSI
jgi:transposase